MSINGNLSVALVTGASSGIGQATATLLQAKGWRVYGLSRSGRVPDGVHALRADVTEAESVRLAVASLWEETRQLDLVVHAAGIGGAGPIEHYPPAEARKIMDTNFMGSYHLAQACLPYLRTQSSAKFFIVSSIAGLMGLPFYGVYAASKFAIEGLVESLRLELRGTGVQVVSICPGDTNTPIIGHQYRSKVEDVPMAYRSNYERVEAAMIRSVTQGTSAAAVAHAILQRAGQASPTVRYTVGEWLQRIAPIVKRILPMRWFENAMAKYYRLS